MRGKSRPQSVEAIIGTLADLQHGAVARWQLLARGVSAQQIERRIKDGRLRPVHRGVYFVGHTATAPLAYEAAAVLAFRGKATISHRSAAKLHGLLSWPPKAPCWVTTPLGDSDRPGLIVRKATLDPSDTTFIERLKCTTAARAILECAAILPPDEDYRLEAMCAHAHSKGAKLPALREQIEGNPGKPGVVRLAMLLDRRTGPARPKRELERRLLKLVRASDLPDPEVNARLEGRERDLAWRKHKLVVETDSYTFHGDAATWAKDIGKTNELQLLGYLVLRFTWFDVTERPDWVIGEIRRAIRVRTT